MAYFQLDKNEKKRYFDARDRSQLTPEDYQIAAQSLLANANEYVLFVKRVSNRDFNQILDVLFPFLSNCGFACELFLKAILCFEKTDYIAQLHGKERHSLYELYGLLSPDMKNQIVCQFPHRNDTQENFELCLKENAQIFFELRYATEYTQLAGNGYFIPDLMITLQTVANLKSK